MILVAEKMKQVDLSTYFETAMSFQSKGKWREARELFLEILKYRPHHPQTIVLIAQSLYKEGKYEQLISFSSKYKGLPFEIDLKLVVAKAFIKMKDNQEARNLLDQLISVLPSHPQVLFHSARNYRDLNLFNEAILEYRKLLDISPNHSYAINNLGNLYQASYQFEKAADCYDRLIILDDKASLAYCNKAGLLQKLGKSEEAKRNYEKALSLEPDNALAHYNLGLIAGFYNDFDTSLRFLQQSITLEPSSIKYQSSYGYAIWLSGNAEVGMNYLKSLIDNHPSVIDPYIKLARVLVSENNQKEAIQILQSAQKFDKTNAECTYIMGILLDYDRQFKEAERYLIQVAEHPEYDLGANLTLQLLYSKIGRLEKYNEMMVRVTSLLTKYLQQDFVEKDMPIYNLAYFPFDSDLVSKVTKKYSDRLAKKVEPLREKLDFHYRKSGGRLRIGYLSPVFRMHPTSILIKDILKYHNRSQFEIIAYGLNGEVDHVTESIRSTVDRYEDLSQLSIESASRKINEDGIDILVSMAGYNFNMKNEIPATRPAPIQVVCMDCHETMQCDFYDYVLKDKVALLADHRKSYSEAIALLPGSHFLRSEIESSKPKALRSQYGLPDDNFIFGCLNHPRKYNPDILHSWATILKAVPGSVLWLYDAGISMVRDNLYAYFENQKIKLDRIFFCGQVHYTDHYKRMELIDLYLDTSVYNGHTTCLEALWMNVPVLTIAGKTVSSRICSSFLSAINLEDLVTFEYQHYIETAVTIANTKKDTWLKKKIMEAQKEKASLFDIPNLVTKLEMAYMEMWKNYTSGHSPKDFQVP